MWIKTGLVLASLAFASYPALARTAVTFAGAGTLDAPLAAEIAGTAKRLDVMAPDAEQDNIGSLGQTLKSLAGRGVKVRLLLTAAQSGLKMGRCVPCDALVTGGVDVRYVTSEGDALFAVIDGPRKRRATGDSARLVLVNGGLATRGDAAMVTFTREGDYVLAFQDEFQHLWTKSYEYTATGSAKAHRGAETLAVTIPSAPPAPWAWFSSANMTPVKAAKGWVFTPTLDRPEDDSGILSAFIAGAIDHAYATVDIASKDLKRATAFSAIRQALARGVRVRILADQQDYAASSVSRDCRMFKDGDSGATQCLARLGAAVAYAPAAKGGVRSNFLVIDGKLALVGNFTWSAESEFQRFGNLVALHGSAVAHYATLFDRRFAAGLRPKATSTQTAALLPEGGKGSFCRHTSLTTSALAGMPELKDYWQATGCP